MKVFEFEDLTQEEEQEIIHQRAVVAPWRRIRLWGGLMILILGCLVGGLFSYIIMHKQILELTSKVDLHYNPTTPKEFYERTAVEFLKNTEQRKMQEEQAKKRAAAAAHNAHITGLYDQVKSANRPLIIYTFHEAPRGRVNIRFFIEHGLHAAADFVFILNGESDVDNLIPKDAPNIRIIKRQNTCYDLGSIGEVLRLNDKELVKMYSHFIFLNDSVRGPFMPTWVPGCWSNYILNKLTEQVKLVGIIYGCGGPIYIQSMLFATDRIGVEILLNGTPDIGEDINIHSLAGLHGCYTNKNNAISAEVSLAHLIHEANYKTHVLMTAASQSKDYVKLCNSSSAYYVEKVHPYETIFLKVNENVDPAFLEQFTRWHDGSEYSSWDACKLS